MNEYMSITEFIDTVHISRPTAYSLISDGKIKAIRVGRAWRIPRDEVERYISAHKDFAHEYIKVAEFREKLGISRLTAYKIIRRGDVKACKIGNAWCIPRNELERYEE